MDNTEPCSCCCTSNPRLVIAAIAAIAILVVLGAAALVGTLVISQFNILDWMS